MPPRIKQRSSREPAACSSWGLAQASKTRPAAWALRQQDLDAAVVRRSNAHDVEAVVWRSAAARYLFLLNHGDRSASLGLAGQWAELATQQPQSETVSLQPFAVKLFVAR